MRFLASCLLALALLVPGVACAQMDSTEGAVTTVTAVNDDGKPNTVLILEGTIVKQDGAGDTDYVFTDSTGSLPLRLDPKKIPQGVTPTTTVRVRGQVNVTPPSGNRVMDVDAVELVTK